MTEWMREYYIPRRELNWISLSTPLKHKFPKSFKIDSPSRGHIHVKLPIIKVDFFGWVAVQNKLKHCSNSSFCRLRICTMRTVLKHLVKMCMHGNCMAAQTSTLHPSSSDYLLQRSLILLSSQVCAISIETKPILTTHSLECFEGIISYLEILGGWTLSFIVCDQSGPQNTLMRFIWQYVPVQRTCQSFTFFGVKAFV